MQNEDFQTIWKPCLGTLILRTKLQEIQTMWKFYLGISTKEMRLRMLIHWYTILKYNLG